MSQTPSPESKASPDNGRPKKMLRLAIALRQVGVSDVVTRRLLATYDLDSIERQLAYLPYRNAKRRSSLIVAAIQEDYERPVSMPEEGSAGA